MASAPRSDLLR